MAQRKRYTARKAKMNQNFRLKNINSYNGYVFNPRPLALIMHVVFTDASEKGYRSGRYSFE